MGEAPEQIVSAEAFYRYEMSLLPVVMAMTARGVRIDTKLRQERLRALALEAGCLVQDVEPIVTGIQERLKERKLFWTARVCRACRNGSKKRLTCTACAGQGRFTTFAFNMRSQRQLCDVLYNGLKLPKRTRRTRVTVDEEALRSLLALDTSGFVGKALRFAKLDTLQEIYERLQPAADGHVRTVFNIAGTYTGRFNSKEAFYIPQSTNLQNLPAEVAKRDPLFAARECVVPDPGEVFLYGDLSQAEARVSAVLSEDWELVERWADPTWDIHRWTASKIFNVPERDIGKDDPRRFLGKKARHALNYGMGPNKFWRTVNEEADLTGMAITLQEAKRIWTAYHALHPKLDAVWWNRVQTRLEARQPMVATHCGWECPFWPRFEADGTLNHDSLRAAVAWEPQHTVVHVLNEGMRDLFSQERGNGFRLLLQGHDSVLLGVDRHRWREVARRVKRTLERPLIVNGRELLIPAEVFVAREHWGALERVL